jgi:hypothetical protein
MATLHTMTLLDVVQAVSEYTTSEEEVVATVAHLVNSGRVRLCGTFAGARIDLSTAAYAVPLSPGSQREYGSTPSVPVRSARRVPRVHAWRSSRGERTPPQYRKAGECWAASKLP